MTQFALAFEAPPLQQARALGAEGMRRAEESASRTEPQFRSRAEALIVEKLRRGPASGEAITDFVRSVLPMKDGRALGGAYLSMAHRGLIEQVGNCPRKKGHGTSGGKVWSLTERGRLLRDASGRFSTTTERTVA
jgi:hypothetical protein